LAEKKGLLLIKLHHGVAGMPDRLLLRKTGFPAFIEFKRPGESPTLIQGYWHERLRELKYFVYTVNNLKDFRNIMGVC
jgi:hypothetical protein